MVCMCNHKNLYVDKTQHATSTLGLETWSNCQLSSSSSKLSVLLKCNVLVSQQQKLKHIHRNHLFLWVNTQQKDCVCQQRCTNRPFIQLCEH